MAVVLVELTPGPNMAWLATLSLTQGRSAGLRAVAGVTLGLGVYMLAAVAGVAGAIGTNPAIYDALRVAGVAFLLWLAWEAWRGAGDVAAMTGDRAPFWRGLVVNLLNPKALVFYVALLPGFIAPDHGPFWSQALLLGTTHLLVSLLVHVGIVLTAAHAARLLGMDAASPHAHVIRRITATGIAIIAVWLWLETAR
jgi:threonine/homoserine/homoserine lactone efflux protein